MEALLDFPGLLGVPDPFRIVITEVNDDHLVVRYFGEHCLEAFRIPEIVLVAECPALCNPDGIRVACGDGTVDGLAVFCEQLVLADGVTFLYREFHFIETV